MEKRDRNRDEQVVELGLVGLVLVWVRELIYRQQLFGAQLDRRTLRQTRRL